MTQRSRPLALLGLIRRSLYAEMAEGRLPSHMHYIIEIDIKEMDRAVSSCERLFSSPIPPNMARHAMRSLMLWLLALPLVLTANALHPLVVALWTFTTSYIYIGVDELGAQADCRKSM